MTYDANSFRDRRRRTVKLRSGPEVITQNISLQALIMNAEEGELPDFLVQQLYTQLTQGTQTKKPSPRKVKQRGQRQAKQQNQLVIQQNEMNLANMQGLLRFNRLIVCAGLVQPKIVPDDVEPNYDAGEIWFSDLNEQDIADIMADVFPQEEQAIKAAGTFPQGS